MGAASRMKGRVVGALRWTWERWPAAGRGLSRFVTWLWPGFRSA